MDQEVKSQKETIEFLKKELERAKELSTTRPILKCGNCGSLRMRRNTKQSVTVDRDSWENLLKTETFHCDHCGEEWESRIRVRREKASEDPDVVIIGTATRKGEIIRVIK